MNDVVLANGIWMVTLLILLGCAIYWFVSILLRLERCLIAILEATRNLDPQSQAQRQAEAAEAAAAAAEATQRQAAAEAETARLYAIKQASDAKAARIIAEQQADRDHAERLRLEQEAADRQRRAAILAELPQ
jgi:predicted lipid-binding transport protein (Tim44 family)